MIRTICLAGVPALGGTVRVLAQCVLILLLVCVLCDYFCSGWWRASLPLVYSGSGLHSYMSGSTARGGADDALFSKILCTGYISTHCLLRIISNAKLVD